MHTQKSHTLTSLTQWALPTNISPEHNDTHTMELKLVTLPSVNMFFYIWTSDYLAGSYNLCSQQLYFCHYPALTKPSLVAFSIKG